MKSFFVKFAICIIPCLVAGLFTGIAVYKYQQGESGGFKLGVDLVGGTILVYEIDLTKKVDRPKTEKEKKDGKKEDSDRSFDPVKDINILADALKRRIDPNDLYNITIRPAGGEGRIEIILPTGGTHRAQKAEDNWKAVLADMQEKFVPGTKLQVGRGKILELADKIQAIKSDKLWREQLFTKQDAWDRLLNNAKDYWAKLHNDMIENEGDSKEDKADKARARELRKKFYEIKPGDFDGPNGFTSFILKHMRKTEYPTTPKTVQNWIKRQAWDESMTQVRRKWLIDEWKADKEYDAGAFVRYADKNSKGGAVEIYRSKVKIAVAEDKDKKKIPNPAPPEERWEAVSKLEKVKEPFQEDMERIPPDSVDQLVTFVLTRGTVIGQAALSLVHPLVGDNMDRVFEDGPDAAEVRKEVLKHYGEPVQEILAAINKRMEETGQNRDLSVEEVQRIKELVSKVGLLEFRILANKHDDGAAIDDAMNLINAGFNNQNAAVGKELAESQAKGAPPPAPTEVVDGETRPKRYTIDTRVSPSRVTYSWVELGPQQRKDMNLDNAARTDPERNVTWVKVAGNRNKAMQIAVSGTTDQYLLHGALIYSRECKDRNLPEDERRKKEFEYFVLTRDPEFITLTSDKRRPRIDGGFLVSANGSNQEGQPTVHFKFNAAGGDEFANITAKNVSDSTGPEATQKRRHLAIILDGLVMSAPTINSQIRQEGQITGRFSQKEVDSLVNILRAGRLPATLKPQPVSESSIAATLGQDTIRSGVWAIFWAFVAILAFMVIYYRFAGLVASIALLANLLLTVGFMVAVQATFTLSGLAGIVLTLGMAVDANVLIYERLREERERGATLMQAIRNGYDRALPTIIDTHLSSIFTAIVLYVVGNDNLKGFAISMTVGLIISLFTSLYMTRVMFDFWQERGWLTKLTMMRLFAKPDIDFMSIRYIMFAVTLGLSIFGAALFIGRLPNDLNIDFVGGTAYGGKLTKGVTVSELRKLVSEDHQKEVLAGVQIKQIDTQGRRFTLTYPYGDKAEHLVTFSNAPQGTSPEDRLENLKKHASMLPEPSPELLYPTSDDPVIVAEMKEDRSRNFMIRTTEKEPELVQTILDQLLREQGTPLLKKIVAHLGTFDTAKNEVRASISFFKEKADAQAGKDPNAFAAPTFVKSLLNREFHRAFGKDEKESLPFVFEVLPEGESDSEGKHSVIKVTFSELKEDDHRLVKAALDEAVRAFENRPSPDRLENFDSALATETRLRAMWAILASWAAMLVYLWFRFGNWTFGLAAVICLIHDLCFTLGAIAGCYFVHGTWFGNALLLDDFKLDLTSVAALLTLVGYSCSDTIVVFDRIREVRGKNPDLTIKMLNDSVNQTLGRTILASLTVWLVVFVLYVFGGPGVHLFGFVMVIGVIVGTYSSIYIAAPLLLMFGEGKHEDTPPQEAKVPAPAPAVPSTAIKA